MVDGLNNLFPFALTSAGGVRRCDLKERRRFCYSSGIADCLIFDPRICGAAHDGFREERRFFCFRSGDRFRNRYIIAVFDLVSRNSRLAISCLFFFILFRSIFLYHVRFFFRLYYRRSLVFVFLHG